MHSWRVLLKYMKHAWPCRPALQRKSDLCTPRKETARPQSQFPHSCFCLWAIYIFPRSVHLFSCSRLGDRPLKYINRSQKYECRNWNRGRAVSFLRIYISNFRYTVFEVCYLQGPIPARCICSWRSGTISKKSSRKVHSYSSYTRLYVLGTSVLLAILHGHLSIFDCFIFP